MDFSESKLELKPTTNEKTPIPYPVASLPISKGTIPYIYIRGKKKVRLILGVWLWVMTKNITKV
jgi:hypothetical protein